jgi:predicted O-methyltransferase YrrM
MSASLTDAEAERLSYVESLFEHLLLRKPRAPERDSWLHVLQRGLPERELFKIFVRSKEYLEKHKVVPGFPDGHYYSPVVCPDDVLSYWERSSTLTAHDLSGIDLDLKAMTDFWRQNEACLRAAPFSEEPGSETRYYYSDGRYPKGDALVLMCMINTFRPKRIIEIGSGFSSAVMLDTADMLKMTDLQITCIDPYADRLRSLLRPKDHERVKIVEDMVQNVSLETFEVLGADDFLFIDSSHVLKTGSDVHFELFSILPRLKPGVRIHFHDIQFPFEYPRQWVFEKKWSWNEIYALRAFLMFSSKFKVHFFTDYFLRENQQLAMSSCGSGYKLIGGSMWLECR